MFNDFVHFQSSSYDLQLVDVALEGLDVRLLVVPVLLVRRLLFDSRRSRAIHVARIICRASKILLGGGGGES